MRKIKVHIGRFIKYCSGVQRHARQVKKRGVFVGKNEKYKTISEALDANEKIILLKKG